MSSPAVAPARPASHPRGHKGQAEETDQYDSGPKQHFFLSVKISHEQPPLSLPSAFPGSRNVLVSSSTSPLPGLYRDRCGNERLRQTALTGRIEGGLFQKKKKKKVVRELKATGSRVELQPLVRGDRFYCFVL